MTTGVGPSLFSASSVLALVETMETWKQCEVCKRAALGLPDMTIALTFSHNYDNNDRVTTGDACGISTGSFQFRIALRRTDSLHRKRLGLLSTQPVGLLFPLPKTVYV